MERSFSIAGHPLHPFLVLFPVGLLVWAFVANVIFAFSDDNMTWYDIGFWTTWAAVIAVIPAGLTGLIDYARVGRHQQPRLASTHMLLNIAITALFVASGILMMDEGATEGTNLTAVLVMEGVGVALLAVSGWLGQEMVYRHGLAMSEQAEVEVIEHRDEVARRRRAA